MVDLGFALLFVINPPPRLLALVYLFDWPQVQHKHSMNVMMWVKKVRYASISVSEWSKCWTRRRRRK
jgi:hypothetical protein